MVGKALSQSALLERTLAFMEEDTQITRKQGKDFLDSLNAAIGEALGNGQAVNIVGMAKLTPTFKLGGRREVNKEWGNAAAGKEIKNFPNIVRVGVSVLKEAKLAAPSPTSKTGKALKELAEEKAAKAAQRRQEREKEAAKAERQAKRQAAPTASKKKAKK